jgi:hypothetical protein
VVARLKRCGNQHVVPQALNRRTKYEIGTAGELKRWGGLAAEKRPRLILNPERVPEKLRHLLLIGLFQQAPMYWGQAFERSAAPRICL